MKAVILESTGKTYRVLCQDGTFRKIKVKHPVEIGSEIQLREKKFISPRNG